MEFKDTDYRVWYEAATQTVFFEGSLRLNTREYQPLTALLERVAAARPQAITLNLRDLDFLNSSGINALYKFVIALRKSRQSHLVVQGNEAVGWQTKSLRNIQRFLPSAEVRF